MFKRIIARLKSESAHRKRRTGRDLGLVFEVLEHRTLLAASPLLGGMSGHEFGNAGQRPADRQSDRQSGPAEFQTVVARDPLRQGDPARGNNGGANGQRSEPPRRGSHPNGVGDISPPPLFDGAAPLPPPRQGSATLAVPNAPPPLTVAGSFVAPRPIVTPSTLTFSDGVNATPTTRPADLSVTGVEPDVFAADVSGAPAAPFLGGPLSESPTRSGATDQHDIFATMSAMSAMELLQDKLTVIDEIVEARRVALIQGLEPASTTDAVFASSALNDSLQSDSTQANESKPFREGFVDIGEPVDELLREASPRTQSEDSERKDFQDVDEADSTVDGSDQNELSSAESWMFYEGSRASEPTDPDSEPPSEPAMVSYQSREGMIELAHRGNAVGESEQVGEAETLTGADVTFLKMDGSVARYQAFKIAPGPSSGERGPLPSVDSLQAEQPASENVSVESSIQGHTAAGATVVPALLTLVSRRRSRRRSNPMP